MCSADPETNLLGALIFTVGLAGPPVAVFSGPNGTVEVRDVVPRNLAKGFRSHRLEFLAPGAAKPLRIELATGGPYGIALWHVEGLGLPAPTIAVVSAWLAGDRVVIEPTLVSLASRPPVELLPEHPDLDAPSAACLYPPGNGRPPLLTTATWTGGYCVVCWPKPFVVTRYEFDGVLFRMKWRFTTSRSFDDAAKVIAHYGIPCELELLSASEDHIVERGTVN